jgi:hypothetical protein
MLGALIGSVLTILVIVALGLSNLEVFEDGSYIFRISSDIPFSQVWQD